MTLDDLKEMNISKITLLRAAFNAFLPDWTFWYFDKDGVRFFRGRDMVLWRWWWNSDRLFGKFQSVGLSLDGCFGTADYSSLAAIDAAWSVKESLEKERLDAIIRTLEEMTKAYEEKDSNQDPSNN